MSTTRKQTQASDLYYTTSPTIKLLRAGEDSQHRTPSKKAHDSSSKAVRSTAFKTVNETSPVDKSRQPYIQVPTVTQESGEFGMAASAAIKTYERRL